jgi:hypothetical protein
MKMFQHAESLPMRLLEETEIRSSRIKLVSDGSCPDKLEFVQSSTVKYVRLLSSQGRPLENLLSSRYNSLSSERFPMEFGIPPERFVELRSRNLRFFS